MQGPDFPTGGILMGVEGVRNIYTTGQGRVIVRGVAEIEESPKAVTGATGLLSPNSRTRSTKPSGLRLSRRWSKTKGSMASAISAMSRTRTGSGSSSSSKGHDVCGHSQQPVQIHGAGVQFLGFQPRDCGRPPRRSSTSTALLGNFVHHRIEVIRRRSEFDLNKAKRRSIS